MEVTRLAFVCDCEIHAHTQSCLIIMPRKGGKGPNFLALASLSLEKLQDLSELYTELAAGKVRILTQVVVTQSRGPTSPQAPEQPSSV